MTMHHIASYTFSAQSNSAFTFSNIPQTFAHLEIRTTTLLSNGSSGTILQFNGDNVAANYAVHRFSGNGASVGTDQHTTGSIPGCWGYGARSVLLETTNPGFAISTILNYTDTSKRKVVKSTYGVDKNGSGEVGIASGLWMNTSAITSITMNNYAGGDWFPGTRYDLYGITNSPVTGV